jgi:hypothetical protein
MANRCKCGGEIETGHFEQSVGDGCDTIDVWWEKCAGDETGMWCGYYRVFDNPPNTASTGQRHTSPGENNPK